VPLLPTRSSPSLAQRLGDRRRGLALVGLAAAALIGVRAARRRAAGGPPDYAPPPIPPDPGPPEEPVTEEPVAAEPVEPNTEELAAADIAVLAILSQEGRVETDRTALAVATTLERETVEVAALLRKLHNQGHVAAEEYTASGEKIWNVTDAGADRL
jgi:hypothetical protein